MRFGGGGRVGVGIVGGGLMGREAALALRRWPALVDHPVRPQLTAVCDVNPAALDWFRAADPGVATMADYRDLLDDPSVDVVYIAVRHDLHEQLAVDLIGAGKHLLVEKPFGIDIAAGEAILAAARSHPEVLVRVSSEMPYFPGATLAVDVVRSGALGRIIEAHAAFLHSSDLDPTKPINWKRQVRYCGEAGVLNDLGMHTWHVPLRLGWRPTTVSAVLQNLVTERPDADGTLVPCDTWDNAVLTSMVEHPRGDFPLVTETKRIAPGHKNTWSFEAVGMEGGVRFSTKNPKRVEVLTSTPIPGAGVEQVWQQIDTGSQSVWPTVTAVIFESGFADAILQMWAIYLAELAGGLGDRFGTVTPEEAVATHVIYEAAIRSNAEGRAVRVGPPA